jgi:Holliday junction resolvase RusA-like endonuclease
MQCKLILNLIKPFSVNGAYWKNRKHNKACKAWKVTVLEALNSPSNASQLKSLVQVFDPALHAFYATITVYYPTKKFFIQGKNSKNPQGSISSKTMDLTNTEKLLIDLIFNHTLQIDDRYITDLKSEKRPSNEGHSTEVHLSLVPLSSLKRD